MYFKKFFCLKFIKYAFLVKYAKICIYGSNMQHRINAIGIMLVRLCMWDSLKFLMFVLVLVPVYFEQWQSTDKYTYLNIWVFNMTLLRDYKQSWQRLRPQKPSAQQKPQLVHKCGSKHDLQWTQISNHQWKKVA